MKSYRTPVRLVAASLALWCCGAAAQAADWSTYRGNLAHSSSSAESLSAELAPHWEYQAPAAPQKGWAGDDGKAFEGKIIMERVKFDDALQVTVADGRLYFGSSVDHQVHCRDAASGKLLWTVYTGGPVRLAPTVAGGRIYFGSDDGFVYCLDAASGNVVWKLRAGPAEESMLARGEMINRWPIRTSVLVDDGVAYFGAGIFPSEEVFLYAVSAADGRVIWRRDNISHEDAGRNDLSPQGYLLASDTLLFVPSGRSLPAAVDRRTGDIVHKRTHSWRSTAGGVVGGTEALLADGQIYSFAAHHILAMDQKNGDVGFGYFDGRRMAAINDVAYLVSGRKLMKVNRLTYAKSTAARQKLELEVYSLSRKLRDKGPNIDELRQLAAQAQKSLADFKDQGVLWEVDEDGDAAVLVAGDRVFVGGANKVTAYRTDDGQQLWQAPLKGDARGLAVANGRLYASTTEGQIVCFGPADDKPAAAVETLAEAAYPTDELTPLYEQAADAILKRSGVEAGFCLVVGGEQGRLAYELARRSDLRVYAVEPSAEKVEQARRALSRAGYYGHRVTVHQADLADIPYSNYFANLVVSDTLLLTGKLPPAVPTTIARHVKPIGGVVCLGRPAAIAGPAANSEELVEWLTAAELGADSPIQVADGWALLTRGKLPGAGNWTHQYGDPGNTAASDESRVRGGLGVLWFGDPGPTMMVNRHDGAVGPLAVNGRMIVQGDDTVMAYDAYNGQFLWEFKNPEAVRTGVFFNENPGNLAASDDAVFTFSGAQCYEIDLATGALRRVHRLPPQADDTTHEWGYIAYRDGLLFGAATIRAEIEAARRRRGKATQDSTDMVFAIDTTTGDHLWHHLGKSISHSTLALGPDRVYFIDSSITSEQRAEMLRQDKTPLKELSPEEAKAEEARLKKIDLRMAVALEARTGRELWSLPVDVTDCSDIGIGGGRLTMLYSKGMLLLCGANANGHYWTQFIEGDFSRRRLVAINAESGDVAWHKDANYRHRPIIVGDRVIAEPWAFSLYDGEQQTRPNIVTQQSEPWSIMRTGHHCGMITGCENMLFFRSGFTGYYDLVADVGAEHFAGHRMGCWINAIPANGLVMIPEAGAGCVCLFSIESTVVFEPRDARRPWAIYSSVGELKPAKHLAINLGAPGDRRDARGTVWLTYPRPKPYRATGLEANLEIKPKFVSGGGFHAVNEASHPIAETETPWIYTSWARGLSECRIPLRNVADGPAAYDVKLYLTDVENTAAGQRVFDIKLQGQVVAENVDIIAASGGRGVALTRVVPGVHVTDDLLIELVPKNDPQSSEQMPTLSAVEVTLSGSAAGN